MASVDRRLYLLYNNGVCLNCDIDEEWNIMKLFGKKNKILTTVCLVLAVALTAALAFYTVHGLLRKSARQKAYDVNPLTDIQIQKIRDNSKAKKLMVVAHPDDDVIWGGAHLMDGDSYVVCITNGRNDTRRPECEKMLEKSGNSGIILEYPDKVLGERDEWTYVWDKIKNDLERIMSCKKWELIVTHNKAGEYGHQHHKYSHTIVTEIYDRLSMTQPLYNFGTYYSPKKLPDHESEMTKVSQERFKYKDELVKVYESQENTVKKLWHMGPYEMWTQYEQYSENPTYRK